MGKRYVNLKEKRVIDHFFVHGKKKRLFGKNGTTIKNIERITLTKISVSGNLIAVKRAKGATKKRETLKKMEYLFHEEMKQEI